MAEEKKDGMVKDEDELARQINEAADRLGEDDGEGKAGEGQETQETAVKNEAATVKETETPNANPKNSEKPEEKVPGEDEYEGIPDIEPGKKPKGEDYKALRDLAKDFKKKAKEYEKQLDEFKKGTAVPPNLSPKVETRQEPNQSSRREGLQSSTPSVPIDRILEIYVGASQGKYGEKGEEYVNMASDALSEYSPFELAEAFQKAKRGGYGECSEEIVDKLRDQIPLAQVNYLKKEEEGRKRMVVGEQIANSRKRAEQKYPDLLKPDTELAKEYTLVVKELIGEFDQSGRLVKEGVSPNLLNHPNVSEMLAEQASIRLAARRTSEYDKILKERDELKLKMEKIKSPEGGGASRTVVSKPEDADLEESRAEIRRLQAEST